MVGREVTPMRRWQNGSINAFTLSHKSGVLRLPPLTYIYTCPPTCTYGGERMCASVHLWKERDVEAPTLYGKSPLWGIRLLVAKHRYIAFGVAQRVTLSFAYPPIQLYPALFSPWWLRAHAHVCKPRAYNTYFQAHSASWAFESVAATRPAVTRINISQIPATRGHRDLAFL